MQVKNLRKGLSLDQLPLDAQLHDILDDNVSLANFLTDIFSQEVEISDSLQTLFRGNCMASKIMSHCFRTFGSKYLKQLLEPHIKPLTQPARPQLDASKDVCSKSPSRASCSSSYSNHTNDIMSSYSYEQQASSPRRSSPENHICRNDADDISYEIDSARLDSDADIDENQKNLLKLTRQILESVLSSANDFPAQLNLMCVCLRQVLCERFPNSNTYLKAIGTVIFLRFINPAIVAPYEAGIVDHQPTQRTMRGLMLVSKILQNIANNVEFSKEEHMLPFNDFVRTQFGPMRQWVSEISSERPGSEVVMASINNVERKQQPRQQL